LPFSPFAPPPAMPRTTAKMAAFRAGNFTRPALLWSYSVRNCPTHERPHLSGSRFPVPGSRLSPPGERPHILSAPRKARRRIPTIPTGYTLGYTRRCQKPPNRPLGVSNPYQKGSKRRQKLAKRRLPILTFGRKTAPRPIHPLGGYQKWGISPNRVYYSERDTIAY
jgi:hypothetical protein